MDELFALKSGTAINLFIRDMPRLSADLDLALIPNKVLVLISKFFHMVLAGLTTLSIGESER